MESAHPLPPRLLDAIYQTASDDEAWPHVLAQIADLTGAQGGVIFGESVAERVVAFEYNGRLSEACSETYRERHIQNPISLPMNGVTRSGDAFAGRVLYSRHVVRAGLTLF